MAPDALRFLASLVSLLSPRHVLEFGSGRSTSVLAWAGAGLAAPSRVTSVEHDRLFLCAAARALQAQPRKCPVRFQFAPLVARDCTQRLVPMYDWRPARFASRLPPDLVVIDGPPSVLGSREGTLYQVLEVARQGTLVLLDDVNRPYEQLVLKRWQEHLGEAIEVRLFPAFAKGLAAILIHEAVPISRLWAHSLALAARDIADLVPPGEAFILVDEAQWTIDVGPRRALPFLERDGEYWGPPPDDATAIAEVERLRRAGARFIVFARPAFWWLEHYRAFSVSLRSSFACVLESERLVVFDLR
jgi:predicted O-methyltransferase YrrM